MTKQFEQVFERLRQESREPWELAFGIQEYVSEALAWIFSDRIEQTGSFQHSITPDFYIHFEAGPALAVHLRFNPVSLHSLLVHLPKVSRRFPSGTKHIILVREPFPENPDFRAYGLSGLRVANRRWLVTSMRLIDEVHSVVDVVEEADLNRVGIRLRKGLRKVQDWLLSAHGWQAPIALNEILGPIPRMKDVVSPKLQMGSFATFSTTSSTGIDVAAYLKTGCTLALRRHTSIQLRAQDRSDNFQLVERLNEFGRATAIVAAQDKRAWLPLVTLVFSTHAPMGQNPFQIFPQAVASVSRGVPFLLVTPDRLGVERRDGTSRVEELSPLFYQALGRLMDIYNVPAIGLPWPTAEDAWGFPRLRFDTRFRELPPRADGSIQLVYRTVDIALKAFLEGFQPAELLMGYQGVLRHRLDMEERRLRRGSAFLEQPSPKSGTLIETGRLPRYLRDSLELDEVPSLPRYMLGRKSSLVFFTDSATLRADPYGGTMMLYDFCFCRSGPDVTQRIRNLVVQFKSVTMSEGLQRLFADSRLQVRRSTREAKLFLGFPDILAFQDGVLVRHGLDKWVPHLHDHKQE